MGVEEPLGLTLPWIGIPTEGALSRVLDLEDLPEDRCAAHSISASDVSGFMYINETSATQRTRHRSGLEGFMLMSRPLISRRSQPTAIYSSAFKTV
jgi:hypothetical protein